MEFVAICPSADPSLHVWSHKQLVLGLGTHGQPQLRSEDGQIARNFHSGPLRYHIIGKPGVLENNVLHA